MQAEEAGDKAGAARGGARSDTTVTAELLWRCAFVTGHCVMFCAGERLCVRACHAPRFVLYYPGSVRVKG